VSVLPPEDPADQGWLDKAMGVVPRALFSKASLTPG